MTCWAYTLASKPGRTLDVGGTNNLIERVYERREGLVDGFTRRYHVKALVYFSSARNHRHGVST
jgi:putative endonuclease